MSSHRLEAQSLKTASHPHLECNLKSSMFHALASSRLKTGGSHDPILGFD